MSKSGAAVVIMLAVGVTTALSGCSVTFDPFSTSAGGHPTTSEQPATSSSTNSKMPESTPTPAQQPHQVGIFSLRAGDCIQELISGALANVNVVPCSTPHNIEVYASIPAVGDVYPGDQQIDWQATNGCAAQFTEFVGIPQSSSSLATGIIPPDQNAWSQNIRSIICVVHDPGGPSVGTLQSSRR